MQSSSRLCNNKHQSYALLQQLVAEVSANSSRLVWIQSNYMFPQSGSNAERTQIRNFVVLF